jgi:putative membrane protein
MMGGIWILWIVLVGLIIWGVRVSIQQAGRRDSESNVRKSALDILRERYARGEIDEEEFESRKRALLT